MSAYLSGQSNDTAGDWAERAHMTQGLPELWPFLEERHYVDKHQTLQGTGNTVWSQPCQEGHCSSMDTAGNTRRGGADYAILPARALVQFCPRFGAALGPRKRMTDWHVCMFVSFINSLTVRVNHHHLPSSTLATADCRYARCTETDMLGSARL